MGEGWESSPVRSCRVLLYSMICAEERRVAFSLPIHGAE